MLEEKDTTYPFEEKNGTEDLIEKRIDLSEENIKKLKDQIADEVREEAGISEEHSDLFREMLDEATMPVEYLDKDFKLGTNELDIRSLSKKNKEQMFFRAFVLHSVYLKNIQSSLLDITRLLLILLDRQGVENIVQATDDIIVKINEQNEALRKIIDENKKA